MKQNNLVIILYTVLKESVDNITLPTGKTLLPSLKYSLIILITSLLSDLFNLFTFISWQGALLGCLCLVGLCFIERSEDNEISRLYRDVKLRSTDVKRWAKSPSFNKQNARASNDSDEYIAENRSGANSNVQHDDI